MIIFSRDIRKDMLITRFPLSKPPIYRWSITQSSVTSSSQCKDAKDRSIWSCTIAQMIRNLSRQIIASLRILIIHQAPPHKLPTIETFFRAQNRLLAALCKEAYSTTEESQSITLSTAHSLPQDLSYTPSSKTQRVSSRVLETENGPKGTSKRLLNTPKSIQTKWVQMTPTPESI